MYKRQQQGQTQAPPRPKKKFLDNYCINLTDRARQGKLDAMIGREEELERVIQILNRRQKNNPCLIGEPGVGKTAIAEGLAQRIADRKMCIRDSRRPYYATNSLLTLQEECGGDIPVSYTHLARSSPR